ncbi:hypothetical protein HOH67_01285 [Candidatus Peregrinibacteria bacterium]|jgi:folylpolyglutamate synthase/dihydropteroate synthase|nr:hypothetical protein [Candidatus Peregrinibacteria bacterium]
MIDHLAKVHQELGGLKTPVIHIAGSKGKGTTANLLGKILELSGKKVGVFSSPFMYKVEEMAKINGVPMENMQAYVDRVQSVNADLSEFEYWTLASLLYFSEQDLDYVILECGWGGLNDATNIISDKVLTILGHIELEHTEVLGDSIEKITQQKLGICRDGVPLITETNQSPDVFDVIVKEGYQPIIAARAELGEHHPGSAGLALAAADQLGFVVTPEMYKELCEYQLFGRFEIVNWGGHTIVLDGAHTYDSVYYLRDKALSYAVEHDLPEPIWCIHFLKDKRKDLPDLFPSGRTAWINLKDKRAGTAPDFLAKSEPEEFIKRLKSHNPSFVVFVGSFKLVSAIKAMLK